MDVVAQVAAALAAAHATGLVHRDVKPANLLMGRDGLVKITDFGIAHAAGSAPLTQAGMLVGTPAYLAPERTAGEPATAASDLYSLGIVAYECLTGAPPFRGTPIEIAGASRFQPLPPLPAAVPAPVTALVADLAAKDPAARPDGAGEVAARAGLLRDAMNGGLPGVPAGRPEIRSPARTGGHTAVLLEPQGPATELLDPPSGPEEGWPPGGSPAEPFAGGWDPAAPQPGRRAAARWHGRPGGSRRWPPPSWWPWPGGCWPAPAAARPSRPSPPPHRASPGPGTHGPAMVSVNAAALLGRPVGSVREYLAGRGAPPGGAVGHRRPGTRHCRVRAAQRAGGRGQHRHGGRRRGTSRPSSSPRQGPWGGRRRGRRRQRPRRRLRHGQLIRPGVR